MEARLTSKIDKLSEQIQRLDDRLGSITTDTINNQTFLLFINLKTSSIQDTCTCHSLEKNEKHGNTIDRQIRQNIQTHTTSR